VALDLPLTSCRNSTVCLRLQLEIERKLHTCVKGVPSCRSIQGILNDLPKRKPSPDFSDEGLVDSSLSSYLLQHLPGQHFALPLQQSAAGDVAVAVLMHAAKVAIKRRYFIRSSF
jgi:hypothetical protein